MAVSSAVWDRFIGKELARFDGESRLRSVVPVRREHSGFVFIRGLRLVNFSSNDYLGLSFHPDILEASRQALTGGAGAAASRLLTGGSPECHALEEKLAAFKRTEASLLFSNGYMANVGVISALAGRDDAVFSDRLNHASIWDGARLSGATVYRYPHGDMDRLEKMLEEAGQRGARRCLIVTESLFGMDGDVAPLDRIVELKDRFGGALMVDEAHAGGVFGPQGEGLAYAAGVESAVDIHLGTFGKAFGVYGAYVAGKKQWMDYLINACRTFIYTTALPPATVGAISRSIDLVSTAHDDRRALIELGDRLRVGLKAMGLDTGPSTTHIVPLIVGESARAAHLGRGLEERGVLAAVVRPPVVPQGKARLRFSLTATHSAADVDHALEAVEGCLVSPPMPARN